MKTFTEEESQVFIDEGRADQILRFGRNNDLTIPVINVWDEAGRVYYVAPFDCIPEAEEVEIGGIVEEIDNQILYYADIFNKEQAMLDELHEHVNQIFTLNK